MDKKELREVRKRKLLLVTIFTLREGLSELSYRSSEDRIVLPPTLLANELLIDMDFFNNKVKSPKMRIAILSRETGQE